MKRHFEIVIYPLTRHDLWSFTIYKKYGKKNYGGWHVWETWLGPIQFRWWKNPKSVTGKAIRLARVCPLGSF